MAILTIRHVTTYRYRQPVAFGEHRMMLRPRDDDDQRVLDCALEITPAPCELSWARDTFGNHIAIARFADRAAELCFATAMRIDHALAGFDAASIADGARVLPFAYPPHVQESLAGYIAPGSRDAQLERWAAGFLRADGSADLHELLVTMTGAIRRTVRHVARHERGIQDPVETLQLASGSCRDVAMLMIAALRTLGIATRFVSGYLHLADDDPDRTAGGNTHAWVQVYVPGPGWVDCDPSRGTVGNRDLVRVAAVAEPADAIPLQGSWIGLAADHLAMTVAVKVTAAEAGAP